MLKGKFDGKKERKKKDASASRSELRTSIPARASRNRLAHQSAWDEAGRNCRDQIMFDALNHTRKNLTTCQQDVFATGL